MTYTRKEVIGDCTLYLGDCRDILPTLGNVDAVVTDPPYGIDGGRGKDAILFGKSRYDAAFEDTPKYVAEVCVPAIEVALVQSKRLAVTTGIRCLHMYPTPRDIGGFYTPAAVTHGPWGFTCFQPILYYGKDPRLGRGVWPSSITVTEASEKNGHPCPKPQRAWQWLVAKVSSEDGPVLDPFMGSGTTGVACVKLGRQFIGIEIEERYFTIACKRIEEAYRQPDLFINRDDPAPKPAMLPGM